MARKSETGKGGGGTSKRPSKSDKPQSERNKTDRVKDMDVGKEIGDRVRGGRARQRTISDF